MSSEPKTAEFYDSDHSLNAKARMDRVIGPQKRRSRNITVDRGKRMFVPAPSSSLSKSSGKGLARTSAERCRTLSTCFCSAELWARNPPS
jgi:hypothetical protein